MENFSIGRYGAGRQRQGAEEQEGSAGERRMPHTEQRQLGEPRPEQKKESGERHGEHAWVPTRAR